MIARDYVPWEVVLLTSRLIFVGDLIDWLVFIVCVVHINSKCGGGLNEPMHDVNALLLQISHTCMSSASHCIRMLNSICVENNGRN